MSVRAPFYHAFDIYMSSLIYFVVDYQEILYENFYHQNGDTHTYTVLEVTQSNRRHSISMYFDSK
jgi:hypothetical protein